MNLFRHWRLCLAICLLSGSGAWACAICAPSDTQNTVVQQLAVADAVVLASVDAGASHWRIVDVIKGEPPKDPILVSNPATDARNPGRSATWLLAYSLGSQSWRTLGGLSRARAGWARQLLSLRRAAEMPKDGWSQRLAFFVADLQSSDDLAAQVAYEEISAAPYAAMRGLKPSLNAQALSRWLQAPELVTRRPLYTLLLGIAGGDSAAEALQARLLGAPSALNLSEQSSLFAAYLEICGGAGLDWVERQFLRDAARPEQDLQAALLALSVHGNDGVRLSRDRVVQAYAVFVRSNPARAGLVASDLGNWERWEFVDDFAAILKSGAPQAFASRYSMVFYLMRSPTPAAREALQILRTANLL